jgi:hypothetical protein
MPLKQIRRPLAVSFTPGFSQVTQVLHPAGNRLNGFRVYGNITTWLKPGVNVTVMLITGSQMVDST